MNRSYQQLNSAANCPDVAGAESFSATYCNMSSRNNSTPASTRFNFRTQKELLI